MALFAALSLVFESGLSLAKAAAQTEGVSRSKLDRAKKDPETVEAWKAWRAAREKERQQNRKAELVELIAYDRMKIAPAAERLGISRRTAFRWLAEAGLRELLKNATEVAAMVGAVGLDDVIDALKVIGVNTEVDAEVRVKALKAAGELEAKRMAAIRPAGVQINNTVSADAKAAAIAQGPSMGPAMEQLGNMLGQITSQRASKRMALIQEEVRDG